MAKKYDLVVVTGSYTDRNGNPKKNYKTVGALWESDKGPYLTLDRTFNPAGIASDRDSILISCFEPRPRDGKPAGGATADEEIPFMSLRGPW
jgi:hypothetical protein